jgi:hypothetical protein
LLNFILKHYRAAVCLSLILLVIPLGFKPAVAAHAQVQDVLEWVEVNKPTEAGNIVVHPSDVSRIAVSTNNIIYAIDSDNGKFYRSTNGGNTWTDATTNLRSYIGTTESLDNIAVAADKPQVVALVTNDQKEVWVSTDGGNVWYNTALPSSAVSSTLKIQCIAISRGYFTSGNKVNWDIAIGTAIWGDDNTNGEVWVLTVGEAISSWRNQYIFVDPLLVHADVSAVCFSSNYGLDWTILAVASTGSDAHFWYQNQTRFCLGQRDVVAQSTNWNSLINPPIIIIPNEGDDAHVREIISAITLPSDYNSGNSSNRIAFVSYNRRSIPSVESSNDVYRVNDAVDPVQALRLNAGSATGDGNANISSLTLYGKISAGSTGTTSTGILIAGDYYASLWPYVQVRRCLDPFDPSAVAWQKAAKPPTGPGSAQVAWSSSGKEVYCGTSQIVEPPPPGNPDESAFSRSTDNGNNWEQISLIDTIINISDVMADPNAESLFIAAYNKYTLESVWRTAGEPLGTYWGRIFSVEVGENKLILRASPNYDVDYTLCVGEVGGSFFAISHDRGNSWHQYTMPSGMVDMAVQDEHTIYVALPDGMIRKTENEGAVWQYPFLTGLTDINMLQVTANGNILVGSTDDKVAYSLDKGASFTEISKPVGNIADVCAVQVIADADYAENHIIYAATNALDKPDKGVWRWEIGSSTEWELIDKDIKELGVEQFCGLAVGEEGTLYALRMESVDGNGSGGMNRSLDPESPSTLDVEWDVLNRTLPAGIAFNPDTIFPHTVPFLKISTNFISNTLWALTDNSTGEQYIYAFVDNICKKGAYVQKVGEIGCDPASGRSQEVNLTWEQLSLSDKYEINIAKDAGFTMTLDGFRLITQWNYIAGAFSENASDPFYIPYSLINPAYIIQPGSVFECGHDYFWRMRTRHAVTGEFIRSPWSEVDSFVVKAGFAVTTPYYGPQLLSPENECSCSCDTPVCFSWSPYKETTAYWFELSENYDMSDPLISTYVGDSTAYEFNGKLKCDTAYFWRIIAISPVSDWSAVFSFSTGDKSNNKVAGANTQAPQGTPLWVWVIISIISILIISLLVLIINRRNQ